MTPRDVKGLNGFQRVLREGWAVASGAPVGGSISIAARGSGECICVVGGQRRAPLPARGRGHPAHHLHVQLRALRLLLSADYCNRYAQLFYVVTDYAAC